MSHFTVMVIGKNPEAQLAPFQENNMGDCPKRFLEFKDCTNEVMEEWNNLEAEDYAKFKDKPIETFALERFGYERDNNGERFGYYENPNSKWDWYLLGGRWTGYYKVKPVLSIGEKTIYPETSAIGKPGVLTPPCEEEGRADQLLKKDIDIEGMLKEAEEKAIKVWEEAVAVMGEHHRRTKPWHIFRDCYYPENTDRARKEYYAQPGMIALHKADMHFWDADYLMCPREAYVKKCVESVLPTFAVIKDGKWYERGEMGWWGIVGNEKTTEHWHEEFNKLFMELPDDTLISVYDCHI